MKEIRIKFESDKSVIYDSETDRDICVCYDADYTELLINLLNEYYETWE